MTLTDDLGTLQVTAWELSGNGDIRFSSDINRALDEHREALARVEAEIARLTGYVQKAAEAEQEVHRLQDGLRRIAGHFGANEYEDCQHRRDGWKHSDCLREIRLEARGLLAGQDGAA